MEIFILWENDNEKKYFYDSAGLCRFGGGDWASGLQGQVQGHRTYGCGRSHTR